MENLYTVKELSQKCNVSEKNIYTTLKNNEVLKENIIYKGKKTYLNEEGLKILNEILHKEIEESDTEISATSILDEQEDTKFVCDKELTSDEKYIDYDIEDSKINLDKNNSEEAIAILMEQIKEKDNLIKRLVSLIESNQVILEKDREQLLEDTRYYKTLELLEERAVKFDENIPYLRNKLDYKKTTKKWWKKPQ